MAARSPRVAGDVPAVVHGALVDCAGEGGRNLLRDRSIFERRRRKPITL
jgi:hypothetical protein